MRDDFRASLSYHIWKVPILGRSPLSLDNGTRPCWPTVVCLTDTPPAEMYARHNTLNLGGWGKSTRGRRSAIPQITLLLPISTVDHASWGVPSSTGSWQLLRPISVGGF